MTEYVRYLEEVFERFGPVTVRRMFGGYGVYHQGLMFGLVADDVLYLKADATNAGDFEREGLSRFGYAKNERTVELSYWQAPDRILDDRDEAAQWARRAFEAALRAQGSKRPGSKRSARRGGRDA